MTLLHFQSSTEGFFKWFLAFTAVYIAVVSVIILGGTSNQGNIAEEALYKTLYHRFECGLWTICEMVKKVGDSYIVEPKSL